VCSLFSVNQSTVDVPPIRAWRTARNVGLRELARRVECDPAHLSRIERGLKRPSVELLYRVAGELGLVEAAALLAPYASTKSEEQAS
jgi:transcriptional regulator with XRE-family HTH domain